MMNPGATSNKSQQRRGGSGSLQASSNIVSLPESHHSRGSVSRPQIKKATEPHNSPRTVGGKLPSRGPSSRNIADAPIRIQRSSSGGSLSTSMHTTTPRIRTGLRRTSSSNGLTTTRTTRRPISSQKEHLSSSAQARQMLANRSGGLSRPNLTRKGSSRSIDSDEGRISLSSTGDSSQSPNSKENPKLPKGIQERMKQRAALRAAGASTRSLRSSVSESGDITSKSSRSSTASCLSNTSSKGKQLFSNPRPLMSRSNSGTQLKTSTVVNRKRSSGTKLPSSVHNNGPSQVSSERQEELTTLQQQIMQAKKLPDSGNCGENEKATVNTDELERARERVTEEGLVAAVDSSSLSPNRHDNDNGDACTGNKDQASLVHTNNPTKTPIRSTHGMTSSMLGKLLAIPSMARQVESPVSTTSTVKLELIQSYRREQKPSIRSKKLEELRSSRRSQESQLISMVHNQQEQAHVNRQDETSLDSTDVMAVIVNLRDELSAAQQVIEQQRAIMEELSSQVEGTQRATVSSTEADHIDSPSDVVPLKQYQELHSRFIKLQLDRAWGEFQLRDRITSDALKFHRRLRHWKDQTFELRCSIQNLENDHNQQLEAFKQKEEERRQETEKDHLALLEAVQATAEGKLEQAKIEHAEELAAVQEKADEYLERSNQAEKELDELKKSTQIAFDEFCDAKDRIELLESEIAELKGRGDEDDCLNLHKNYPSKRLARRSSKRDLSDEPENDETKMEETTKYWGSWFYGNAAPAEEVGKEEQITKSPLHRKSMEKEKVDDAKQMLPMRPAAESDKTTPDGAGGSDSAENKSGTWSSWGLPTIFSTDVETSRQDHEMNLTD